MRVIVYGDNDSLILARDTGGGHTYLLRDATRWAGEREPCDSVWIIGDYPEIVKAYADVPAFEPPAPPKADPPAPPAPPADSKAGKKA